MIDVAEQRRLLLQAPTTRRRITAENDDTKRSKDEGTSTASFFGIWSQDVDQEFSVRSLYFTSLAKICKMSTHRPLFLVAVLRGPPLYPHYTYCMLSPLGPSLIHHINPNNAVQRAQQRIQTAVLNHHKHEASRRSGRMCHPFGDDGVRIFFHRRSAPRGSSSLDTNHHRRQRSNEYSSIRPQKPGPETAQRGYGWKWQPIRRRRPG